MGSNLITSDIIKEQKYDVLKERAEEVVAIVNNIKG